MVKRILLIVLLLIIISESYLMYTLHKTNQDLSKQIIKVNKRVNDLLSRMDNAENKNDEISSSLEEVSGRVYDLEDNPPKIVFSY